MTKLYVNIHPATAHELFAIRALCYYFQCVYIQLSNCAPIILSLETQLLVGIVHNLNLSI